MFSSSYCFYEMSLRSIDCNDGFFEFFFLFRYLEEPEALGTACGLYHFRSALLENDPSALFVLNADVCGDLPIAEMAQELFLKDCAHGLLLTTEATREQSINYGSVVIDSSGKVN